MEKESDQSPLQRAIDTANEWSDALPAFVKTGVAAQALGMSERELRDLADSRGVDTYKTPGGFRLYDAREIVQMTLLPNQEGQS